jgi:hypothetical protein
VTTYCGDVGDVCRCCGQRIGLDADGTYACACTSGDCDECGGEDEDEGEAVACGACGGDAPLMGRLGNLNHYRCRQCGTDSSMEARS